MSAASAPSAAVEYGAKATGTTASSYVSDGSSSFGSVTLTVAYDQPLASGSADQTFADYVVKDKNIPSATLSVTVATVNSSGQLVLTVSIPENTGSYEPDYFSLTTTKSVATDTAGAPTANLSQTGQF